MKPSFVFRTIKNGRIKWDHRYWKTRGDTSHIEGRKLVFGTYAPEYKLLCLLGTPELYHYPDIEDCKGEELWEEVCEMMGVKTDDGINTQGGSFLMRQIDEDEWVSYRSRRIDWWKPIFERGERNETRR